jgi:hypothetical protein
MSAPVHPDLTPDMRAAFEHEQDAVGCLDDFKGTRHEHDSRNAGRQAAQIRFASLQRMVSLEFQLGPRQERDVGVRSQVRQVTRQPHSSATQVRALRLRGHGGDGGNQTAILHGFLAFPIM